MAEKALVASEQAAAPASAEVTQALRQVGDKTFLLSDGAWVDTTFDPTKMTAEAVAFGSERYFELLADASRARPLPGPGRPGDGDGGWQGVRRRAGR